LNPADSQEEIKTNTHTNKKPGGIVCRVCCFGIPDEFGNAHTPNGKHNPFESNFKTIFGPIIQ
jgi:hypothetical protein